MWNDESVDEVRAVREAHAALFNYDLRAIFEDLKKSEAARIAAGHKFAPLLEAAERTQRKRRTARS